MVRDDWNSGVSHRCREALLAGVVLVASSGAMILGPVPKGASAADSSAPPAAAGEDQAETARDAAEPAPFQELNAALAAVRAKLDELAGAAEIAAMTADLRTELQAATAENERLTAELERARSALEASQTQLDAANAELEEQAEALRRHGAREEALVEAAERSAAQLAGLRDELAAGERARREAEARMAETKEALGGALAEAAQLRKRLSDAELALGTAEEERDAARAASEQLRSRSERLEQSLAAAREQADRLHAEKADRAERLALLEEAADTAAAAARANLLAMEDKIASLSTALADVRGPEPAAGALPRERAEKADDRGSGPMRDTQSLRAPVAMLPMSPASTDGAGEAPAAEDPDGTKADLGGLAPDAPRRDDRRPLAEVTAALSLEQRMQVQALLADLKAVPEDRGLLLTVPGSILFETNGESVQPTAHETLAKVAEVIDIYDGHDVLITGHTDAIGEASYNEYLSERRAALVKTFFVDNFELDDSRLLTRGLGEKQPIASNATRTGREANRRVEVLILD